MPLSINDLTTHIQGIMPKGYTVTTTPFTTWITESIAEAVAFASPEFRERTFYDCIGDGVTTRYALPGYNIVLLPPDQWTFPQTINTAEVANPTTAPSAVLRSGGSTTPSGATLAFGFAWNTGHGQTQLSPLGTITTTAANQTIDITIPVAPLGVTSCDIFVSGEVLNNQYVSRVAAAHAISTSATTVVTSLGLGDGVNFPLVDYADPTTVTFVEQTNAITLEPTVNADGTSSTTVTNATAITLSTALTSGQRLRVWYTRKPQVPTGNTTPIFGVPDDFLYTAVAAFMHRYLATNHETGAKDQHWQVYLDLHNQALGIKDKNSARTGARTRIIEWGTQIR